MAASEWSALCAAVEAYVDHPVGRREILSCAYDYGAAMQLVGQVEPGRPPAPRRGTYAVDHDGPVDVDPAAFQPEPEQPRAEEVRWRDRRGDPI